MWFIQKESSFIFEEPFYFIQIKHFSKCDRLFTDELVDSVDKDEPCGGGGGVGVGHIFSPKIGRKSNLASAVNQTSSNYASFGNKNKFKLILKGENLPWKLGEFKLCWNCCFDKLKKEALTK